MAWMDQLSALVDSVLGVIFPRCCDFCDGPLDDDPSIPICTECRSTIQRLPERVCERCGLPLAGAREPERPAGRPDALGAEARSEEQATAPMRVSSPELHRHWIEPVSETCPACILDPPPYHRARFSVIHEGRIREALAGFKYSGKLFMRRSLSELLFEGFRAGYCDAHFDMVVAVPVHGRKLRSRGFNQTILLASDLARRIRVPLHRRVLLKTRPTKAQVGLSRAERIRNLAGSFDVPDPRRVADSSILLVDDVSTTGTTIREAASALRSAGARRIDAMVLAARLAKDAAGPGPESM